ncbi:MAG TPA: hypothetical protein VMU44_00015 [Steroidobacteraceae bacterium]|nr:hypothetical protein [Steroidobacteraceae bacterium]
MSFARAARALRRLSGPAGLYRAPVYTACTVAALVITFGLGKDLTWDTLHYHLYAGLCALHDRFAQDYFAAGPQAYLNPWPYAPFYALVAAGLSSVAIGVLLTVAGSGALWLTYELAAAVSPLAEPRGRAALGVVAVALALLNPVLLQELGSAAADLSTAELALAGWLLLLAAVRTPHLAPVLAGAVLLGAASALKLSNALHALAAGVLVLLVPVPWRARLRYAGVYALGGGAAFALIAAPWSIRLAQLFGNPFFPFFNGLFRSPDFITQPLRQLRFIPASLSEALWRPFAMLDPTPMVHNELRAPDGRYALLLLLAAALLGLSLWRRLGWGRSPAAPSVTAGGLRPLAALGAAFALDWMLWLWTSGNSRYFLSGSCVAAALAAALMPLVTGRQPGRWATLAAVAVALGTIHLAMNATGLRWSAVPWDRSPWLRVEVPPRLAAAPALYLSIGANSNAFLAAYLPGGSGFVNFTGAYPLGPAGASGARVAALIRRFAPHLRMLVAGERLYTDLKQIPNLPDVDGALARFGLRADAADCARITVRGSGPDAQAARGVLHLVSCGLLPGAAPEYGPDPAAERAAELILDRLEAACPLLLEPRPPLTEYRNRRYQRVYLNTDLYGWVSRGYVKIANPVSGDGPFFLGPEEEWLRAPPPVVCSRRAGHDFARVLLPGPQRR